MPANASDPSAEIAKRIAAKAAYQWVLPHLNRNTVIGVGTGSTVNCFIDCLAEASARFKGAVPSSDATERLLRARGIAIHELNSTPQIPLYIDGADRANHALQLIKGGGGALTREKIIAQTAETFLCIADESKLQKTLATFPLPVEVIPMARQHVIHHLRSVVGGDPTHRAGFVTDNGNEIIDIQGLTINDPIAMEARIDQIAGVVSNGLFARRPANLLILADATGSRTLTAQAQTP